MKLFLILTLSLGLVLSECPPFSDIPVLYDENKFMGAVIYPLGDTDPIQACLGDQIKSFDGQDVPASKIGYGSVIVMPGETQHKVFTIWCYDGSF